MLDFVRIAIPYHQPNYNQLSLSLLYPKLISIFMIFCILGLILTYVLKKNNVFTTHQLWLYSLSVLLTGLCLILSPTIIQIVVLNYVANKSFFYMLGFLIIVCMVISIVLLIQKIVKKRR